MATQLNMRLVANTRVERIDRAARCLETTSGPIAFGKLVLALGADPIRLPLAGDATGAVLSVNDLADYGRFRERLIAGQHVAIIGAGLIGCEFANDLASAGYRVTVIDPTDRPLAALLPAAAGRALMAPLAMLGVTWRFGCAVTAVDHAASGLRLTVSSGEPIDADHVLSAVGLRPRVVLARAAGLTVGRGIVVDEFLASSDPDIFALGDCAEIGGEVRPYVLPIMNAARALAQTLNGAPTPLVFPAMPVAIKTPALPITVQTPPRGASGDWKIESADGGLSMVFADASQRVQGFMLAGARTSERARMLQRLGRADT